jgi:hypothetical protein
MGQIWKPIDTPAALRGPLLATVKIEITPAAPRFFIKNSIYQD